MVTKLLFFHSLKFLITQIHSHIMKYGRIFKLTAVEKTKKLKNSQKWKNLAYHVQEHLNNEIKLNVHSTLCEFLFKYFKKIFNLSF